MWGIGGGAGVGRKKQKQKAKNKKMPEAKEQGFWGQKQFKKRFFLAIYWLFWK
jgi:hypothetical protein